MRTRVYLHLTLGVCLAAALALAATFSAAGAPARTDDDRGPALTGPVIRVDREAARPAQPLDEGYTAKIREYTTEPFFLTELVDHLPASDTVPTPAQVLGYVIGKPEQLTHTKDIYRYFRALADATPRVRVWTIGRSEEGREHLLVAVSSEANLAALDRYKEITNKLADPRKITDAEAETLIRTGKPFYWATGAIHSPETGSPEMLMELAYRLAVTDSKFINNIRENVIFLITPVVEPDGRDRMVDLYNYRKANPDKPAPGLIYWGKYVAHDNNRDAMVQALELTRTMMRTFLDFKPQVLHDLHESIPYLYVSTGTGPYNAWLDPIVINEWQRMAYHEVEQMTARGVPGVWTHGFYDGWAPNYMFYVANGHNSIGRFYETFGNGGADTRVRRLGAQTQRTWYRPNPPLDRVVWSLRNNTNLMQSGLLFALQYMADNREEFLRNFYLKSKRSIAKATTEGPAAWVIPACTDPAAGGEGRGRGRCRPVLAAQLAHLMQRQGAEVHRLDAEFELKVKRPSSAARGERGAGGATGEETIKFPAGSYVFRMDQPYSRMVDMLLDTQYYSTQDPRPYDDTGWSLGALRNVPTVRVTDTAILAAPMTLLADPIRPAGAVSGAAGARFFLVAANAEPALATLRFRLADAEVWAAQEAFEAEGRKYPAGSFILPAAGNVRQRVEQAARELGLTVTGTAAEPRVARHRVAVPRIAVLHSWVNTQNEGWFRLMLEEWEIPYAYISEHVVRTTPDLKEKFDVIILPPFTNNLQTMIHGVRKRLLHDGSDFGGAIPWQATELTPHMGTSPDTTPDIRGGIGFEGLANLKRFVEAGGVFIPITAATALPIETGMIEGVSVVQTRNLMARGAIYRATVEDKKSPIGYGYDDTVAVYFNQAPVFRVGLTGLGFPGAGTDTGPRTTGRGSATDPDIPQGRPFTPPETQPRRPRAEQELWIDPDIREFIRGSILPPRMWPRVVLRFAPANELWVSGMLEGAGELAETPAVVDVPLGRGHVVLFATNPAWRHQTQGTFMLLLNAALHFDHLHVGHRTAMPGDEAATAEQFGSAVAMPGHQH